MLVFLHVGTRRAFITPATYHPNDAWMREQARAFVRHTLKTQLPADIIMHDRDTKFAATFESTLRHLAAAPEFAKRVATNNPVERFIRELNRRFSMMGAFTDERSWERATYLVWKHLKLAGYPNRTQIHFTPDY